MIDGRAITESTVRPSTDAMPISPREVNREPKLPDDARQSALSVVDTSSDGRACRLCGSLGAVLYSSLSDRLFGAAGEWNYRRCTGRHCGLVWIDTPPNEIQLAQAYEHYYTHQPSEQGQRGGFNLRGCVQAGYLATHYGYHQHGKSWGSAVASLLAWCWPRCRADADGRVRMLHAVPGGSLLDLGCGAGDWLLAMCGLGWNVVGVEFDEAAASLARRRGLDVRSGSLESQRLSEQSFDAITLNHVIEHLPDPVGTLRECRRLLKPNGRLVLFTPNADSLGHQFYCQSWRGLEPPRHLHVFCFASMRRALHAAGFRNTRLLPWVADSILRESWLLWRGWSGPFAGHTWPLSLRLHVRLVSMMERLLMAFWPQTADCLLSISIKSEEEADAVMMSDRSLESK